VRALGAQIVVITPELERYPRSAQKAESVVRYADRSSSKGRRAVSACFHTV
jgi:hypothetical protein